MRRSALLLALLAASCGQEESGRRANPAASAVPPLEAAAARLPDQAAGFTRGSIVWHERERAGLGVSAEYAGPARAAVATVSLYDRAQGVVTEGPGSPRLAREFSDSVAEVVTLAGTRTSQQMAESGRSEVAVPGGAPLSCARLEGTYGRQAVQTLVCVGAAAGRFLKVQVTAPARPVTPVDPLPFVVTIAQAARGT
jgi:hypothetical protein